MTRSRKKSSSAETSDTTTRENLLAVFSESDNAHHTVKNPTSGKDIYLGVVEHQNGQISLQISKLLETLYCKQNEAYTIMNQLLRDAPVCAQYKNGEIPHEVVIYDERQRTPGNNTDTFIAKTLFNANRINELLELVLREK